VRTRVKVARPVLRSIETRDVEVGAVARLRGAGEAFFHRLDHQRGVDHLLARDGLGRLQKFQLVG
jgi:hypothetical protein